MLGLAPPLSKLVDQVHGDEESTVPTVKLQKLTANHKQVVSMMAQGIDRVTVGAVCNFTPEYVTWLMRQEVCQEYLREIIEVADSQLKAQYCKAVDVIGDTLANGTEDGKLKAAKLQLEATGRVGKLQAPNTPPVENDRLNILAGRLVELLRTNRERVVNGEVTDVQIESEVRRPGREGTGEAPRT